MKRGLLKILLGLFQVIPQKLLIQQVHVKREMEENQVELLIVKLTLITVFSIGAQHSQYIIQRLLISSFYLLKTQLKIIINTKFNKICIKQIIDLTFSLIFLT